MSTRLDPIYHLEKAFEILQEYHSQSISFIVVDGIIQLMIRY